jgi:hypothetical protein
MKGTIPWCYRIVCVQGNGLYVFMLESVLDTSLLFVSTMCFLHDTFCNTVALSSAYNQRVTATGLKVTGTLQQQQSF